MNSISLTPILQSIDFINRYRDICSKYDNFSNSMNGNRKELYDQVISKLGYKAKYFSKERFYRIAEQNNGYEFGLQLVLKDGMVEAMLDVKKDNVYLSPDGRFDFIPGKMGIEFDRKKYNLPKYENEQDLESILKEIFLIYEDIKKEVIMNK